MAATDARLDSHEERFDLEERVRETEIVPLSRIKLSVVQLGLAISFVVGLAVSWGILEATLQGNTAIMLRIEAKTATLETEMIRLREHQIVNEGLIDQQGRELDAVERRLGMLAAAPDNRRTAAAGPKR